MRAESMSRTSNCRNHAVVVGADALLHFHLIFVVNTVGIKVLSKQTVVELTGEQPE